MQRPVMDPTFFDKQPAPKRQARPRLAWVSPLLRRAWRFLLTPPVRMARRSAGEDQPIAPLTRFLRGAMYRVLFLPILLSLVASALVFAATHPRPATLCNDPNARDVYYDPVNFVGADGTRLQGLLVPVIDARRVLEKRDDLLRTKHPAVVLVHGFGQSPQQMWSLLAPLHDDGFVVLAVGLRGVGLGTPAGQTFGLNEAGDVSAAVDMLRRRPFIDPRRIALLGIGTGANASLLAAGNDARVAAVVIADPVCGPDDVVAQLAPNRTGLRWLQPLCKWTFELAYHADVEDLDLQKSAESLVGRPVLAIDGQLDADGKLGAAGIERARRFLKQKLLAAPESHVQHASGN